MTYFLVSILSLFSFLTNLFLHILFLKVPLVSFFLTFRSSSLPSLLSPPHPSRTRIPASNPMATTLARGLPPGHPSLASWPHRPRCPATRRRQRADGDERSDPGTADVAASLSRAGLAGLRLCLAGARGEVCADPGPGDAVLAPCLPPLDD